MVKVLDLFCGAGGASMGYKLAGFEVVGVDIKPQPNYPFEFIQDDAIAAFQVIGGKFDLIHASPPCQVYSKIQTRWDSEDRRSGHPDMVDEVRDLISDTPYVIENVPNAPLINPITLCGGMFNLKDSEGRGLRRHRLFESNFFLPQIKHPTHKGLAVGVYGHPGGSSKRDGYKFATVQNWREAMEIDWMLTGELSESIPPAYTKWIGEQIAPLLQGPIGNDI